ncbi:MAG: ribosome biogenesis factor YjgA, partial [Candidatus Methylumidiphilus sp.]
LQYAIRPNKSAIKRENAALEEFGEELIALPVERLTRLDMPPVLFDAVKLAQSIVNHHGAFKRQRKFIAKLMRDMDVEPIRQQLEGDSNVSARAVHQVHLIERWRDRLLKGEDTELNALMADYPHAERPKLRQLIRDARKEHDTEAPPRSARLLFKYLRELMAEEAGEEIDVDEVEE